MPELWTLPQPPSASEPTDRDAALYIQTCCRELERLTDHLEQSEVGSLLREAIDRLQAIIDRDSSGYI